MTLAPGTRRGSYEILSPLGAGGMGEVYRARDSRLGRDVAIKTLPNEFARDPERLARFQREARVLASLNHPNVAAIYGLEEADGANYLVLECVEGETLAERLAAGPLPIEEALPLCSQIAAGLEAAHEAGVIHRDLKPGNVKVRPDGSVKVLDFGLAKGTERGEFSKDQSRSPTISAGTEAGIILGTAAYMSPEQARGKPLDKRADIWSFGCVLYECLTGRQTFRGETVSDTLAAILKSDPDWSVLPAETPAKIRELLKRCLQKDPQRRLHDIADARIEIEEAMAAPEPASPRSGASTRQRLLWGLAGVLAGALLTVLLFLGRSRPAKPEVTLRFAIPLPSEAQLSSFSEQASGEALALSPDGQTLVFRATRNNVAQLWRRSLSGHEAAPIPGTEGGISPFFSPDGQWLAFFTASEIRKVSFAGGAPITICRVPPVSQGGSWGPDGVILFTPTLNEGLSRVSAEGGTSEAFTTPEKSKGEHAHLWPQILPDGRAVLFTVRAGKDFQEIARSNIVAQDLTSGQRRTLIQGSSFARYVPPGWLLFVRAASLFAVSFDAERLEVKGAPARVLDEVMTPVLTGVGQFAASGDGTLVYAPGGMTEGMTPTALVWADRAGKETPLSLPLQWYQGPRLGPEGERLAFMGGSGNEQKIWIYDFGRGVLSLLTTEPGRQFNPVWSPDGKRIAYTQYETGFPRLSMRAADGSGEPAFLTSEAKRAEFPSSWSSDGRLLAFTAFLLGPEGNTDIWLLSFDNPRSARPWFTSPFRESGAAFSPDGRWIAYTSDESGRPEVFVRPFPGPGGKIKISNEGGAEPGWRRDGKELFYRGGDRIMAVAVRTGPEFAANAPTILFKGRYSRGGREDSPREYEVSAGGKRFLMIKPGEPEKPVTLLNVVTNWFAEMDRLSKK